MRLAETADHPAANGLYRIIQPSVLAVWLTVEEIWVVEDNRLRWAANRVGGAGDDTAYPRGPGPCRS